MSWFYRNNAIRAAELNTMAYMIWNRRSTDLQNKLEVRLENPDDRNSLFIVICDGKPSKPMRNRKQVQKYIRRFYDNLLHERGASA